MTDSYTPEVCSKCESPMERTEVLYCEWMDCNVQVHVCPNCGDEYQETLS